MSLPSSTPYGIFKNLSYSLKFSSIFYVHVVWRFLRLALHMCELCAPFFPDHGNMFVVCLRVRCCFSFFFIFILFSTFYFLMFVTCTFFFVFVLYVRLLEISSWLYLFYKRNLYIFFCVLLLSKPRIKCVCFECIMQSSSSKYYRCQHMLEMLVS